MVKLPENVIELNRTAVETAMKLAQVSMENAEKLVRMQLDTAKNILEGNLKNAKNLTEAEGDPQQLVELRTQVLGESMEQMADYSRSVYDLASKTQAELGKLMEQRFAAFNRDVAQWVDEAAKSAPAGTEPAVAAIRQTLATTNAMVDTLAKTTKQFAEAAELNIKSATAAAVSVTRASAKKRAA
jgi:phasin family protein